MPLPDVRQQARARRDVLERPVAAVPIEAVRQALEDARMAVDPDTARLVAAEGIRGRRPLHVVARRGDRGGRRCRSRTSRRPRPSRRWRCPPASSRPRSGRRRDCAAAGSAARPPRRDRHARRCRSRPRAAPMAYPTPRTPAASVTSVNRISPSLRYRRFAYAAELFSSDGVCRAVREEDVGAAVAVVVEDGKPAGHALDEVLVGRGRVLVDEAHAGRAAMLRSCTRTSVDVCRQERGRPMRRRARIRQRGDASRSF